MDKKREENIKKYTENKIVLIVKRSSAKTI